MNSFVARFFACFFAGVLCTPGTCAAQTQTNIGGVYPHLAVWNQNGECGIGAVVPWAGKLWWLTYSPHFPKGSDDKLYSIDAELKLEAFEGSVGGTPANRMIHRESNQLVIGPYFINAEGKVRVIEPKRMLGRLTGNARHLFEAKNKIYYATMEEGIYEVDVNTLDVTELFADYQQQTGHAKTEGITEATPLANLPGYHGKGLFSGQGRLVYANNGESSREAKRDPRTPSGCLAEWDGASKKWQVVRRNQFVDVRGPGGLYGNSDPENDPIWAIGWDHRSLLLLLLDNGEWFSYRLPKASHCYDGAHGWNTEWPRINELGFEHLVMNMHGMFWKFPRDFRQSNSAGISPMSTYLKVIGDYCRWNNQLVFGCDDTAKNEFLNTRKAKGKFEGPGQSHSNLWFTSTDILDQLGVPLGRGAVWVKDKVQANTASEPYLFSGFDHRVMTLVNESDQPNEFWVEVDRVGNNQWKQELKISLDGGQGKWHEFADDVQGAWIRLRSTQDGVATAFFHYRNDDQRKLEPELFAGLARRNAVKVVGGNVRVRGNNLKTLAVASRRFSSDQDFEPEFYELDEGLNLKKSSDRSALEWTIKNTTIPTEVVQIDKASVIYVDDNGQRWRLPKGDPLFDERSNNWPTRMDREVVTERDLFNCHGTFYELPARNAGGFAKIRPICTHNLHINDYCSYRGMLVFTGINLDAEADNSRIIWSEDNQAAVWLGVVDELWKLGRPIGTGGPWYQTPVQKNVPSDPYLMTGYERKTLRAKHTSDHPVEFRIDVDITGDGDWVRFEDVVVPPGRELEKEFGNDFTGYWLRVMSSENTTATAIFEYR